MIDDKSRQGRRDESPDAKNDGIDDAAPCAEHVALPLNC